MASMNGPDVVGRSAPGKLDRSLFALPSGYADPEGDIELRLTRLWEDVLGIVGLGVEDEFLQIGGDSFMGTVLLGEIERAFGETLSLSVLLECRTVRGLARRLAPPAMQGRAGPRESAPNTTLTSASASSAAPPDPCLVPIRPAGSLPPLFMVHGLHCDAG